MRTRIVVLIVGLIVGCGLFLAGRASARPAPVPAGDDGGYAAGLREGRALQATIGLPAGDKAVFQAGYESGANDVFGGYDGGWGYSTPYVISLESGSPGVTYRIAGREEMAPGIDYRLCPDGHGICRATR